MEQSNICTRFDRSYGFCKPVSMVRPKLLNFKLPNPPSLQATHGHLTVASARWDLEPCFVGVGKFNQKC